MTPYQNHVSKWKNCHRCGLCENRTKVCLVRGTLPCDVMFIGEAPGESEDVLGTCFIGPAGKLLDRLIRESGVERLRYAITNLVCCWPRDEEGKTRAPAKEEIAACLPRLREIVHIGKPRSVVLVGELAGRAIPGQATLYLPGADGLPWLEPHEFLRFAEIIHPAAILRMGVAQQGLAYQRALVALKDMSEAIDTALDDIPF